ncbi:DEAD/DEAH box helicase [bacterium SCSIO 12643]|nr:DEAD/DEAH box helicase [bacterium SCSIO 12643]
MSTFQELGLRDEIIEAITELGYQAPTPIQKEAIPQVLTSKTDLIALAQTGTGKTAAFGLPIINQIDVTSTQTQSIILCPTRELCLQISKDLESYSKKIKGLKITAVYGGTSIDPQMRALTKGTQVVVGTPGRVIDLIMRKKLKLQNVQWLVLDEADEMLSMGFKEDLDTILAETPQDKQTLLFSATMPSGIQKITKAYMDHPNTIEVAKRNTGNTDVEHEYYMVSARDRYLALKRLADINPDIYGIVFCRTRRETKEVADKLMQDGYNADSLHGDLSQAQRDYVMNRFRNGMLQILVATDVAARGLDVNELTHVINYNLPDDPEVYVHRSGRTGRAGNKGKSITIIHTREMRRVRELEKMIGFKFAQQKVPTGEAICEIQLMKLIDNVKEIEVNQEQINPFMPAVMEKLGHMEKEDIIKHFVSAEFNRFLDYYKDARDLNDIKSSKSDRDEGRKSRRDRRDRKERGDRLGKQRRSRGSGEFARFFINAGKSNRLNPQRLMGMINEHAPLDGVEIGQIDIQNNFAFFEVDKALADEVVPAFRNKDLDGFKLSVEPSVSMKNSSGEGKRDKKSKGRRSSDFSNRGDRDRSSRRGSDRERSRAKSKKDYRKKSSDFNNSDSKADRKKNRKW